MLLCELINDIEIIKKNISENPDVSTICSDNRKVVPGSVFVCIKGLHHDGHDFAEEAVKKGAVAVVGECEFSSDMPYITVKDSRKALSLLFAAYYGHPELGFKNIIGITGTCGKTSTSFMLKSIFEKSGAKVGLIGTMKSLIGDTDVSETKDCSQLTTPEPEQLFSLFAKMRDSGVDTLIMEVSSQALAQGRVEGIRFSAGIFTNLSRDHIDYHKTVENYRDAKKKLFSLCDIGIFNADDPECENMMSGVPCRCLTYGLEENGRDYAAKNVENNGAFGSNYVFLTHDGICRIRLKIPGTFSVCNSLAAAAAAEALGVQLADISGGLEAITSVQGRIERLDTDTDYSVFIDFAHTPDSLEKIIASVREFTDGRVITLFGCGGDRDKGKRPMMGRVASRCSDFVVVTSDNSRSEEKESIISDILVGCDEFKTPRKVIADRSEAIRYALSIAKPGDSIILAGKGHEEYEIDKNGKHPYSERQIVFDYLIKKNSEGDCNA